MSAGDFAAKLRTRDFYIVRDGPFPESAQEVERYVKVTPEERDSLADLVDAVQRLSDAEAAMYQALSDHAAGVRDTRRYAHIEQTAALDALREALARLGGSAEGEEDVATGA